jgi:hypothetical protein
MRFVITYEIYRGVFRGPPFSTPHSFLIPTLFGIGGHRLIAHHVFSFLFAEKTEPELLERSDAVTAAIVALVAVVTDVTDELADRGEVLGAALLAHVRAGEARDVVRRAHHAERVRRRDGRRVGREGGRVRRLGARRRKGRASSRLCDVDAPGHARAEGADARVGRRCEARDGIRV